jgi:predicted esterase
VFCDDGAVIYTRAIETPTHGRVLVVEAVGVEAFGWLVAFHGYAQSADDVLADVMTIPGVGGWNIAAVQALNRFYARGDEKVIANWMTRQDREQAIADNITYVDRVIDQVVTGGGTGDLVFVGFSQGAAMAYRAARLGRHRASGVIALGGDIPPELKTGSGSGAWPRVLIGAGDAETWYTADKVRADEAFLDAHDVEHEVVRYRGGHLWTDEFRAAAGHWLVART